MSDQNFTPTLGSELDVLTREHAHVSSSLLENRRKGATRFNVYILIVGTALAALGLKGGLIPPDGGDWSVAAAFAFLVVFGWIMLQTLIRRSITTDRHLEALQSLRDRCFHYHPDLRGVIPSAELPAGLPDSGTPLSFETAKQRYYKTGHAGLETSWDYFTYLRKQLFVRELLPHYGDLIENVCALNAFVVTIGLLWLTDPPPPGILSAAAIGLAFAASYIWLWHGQMMYVWYKHTFDLLLQRDELSVSRGGDVDAAVTEAELQERDEDTAEIARKRDRRYMHRLRRAMVELTMLEAAAVVVTIGLVSQL